jgi:uncharacterized protein (DUF1778 family)
MTTKSEQIQIRVSREQKLALKRLASQAGLDLSSFILTRALPSARAVIESAIEGLSREADRRYALAELSDRLKSLSAVEFREALAGIDLAALEPWLRNYVAAMVEQVANRNGEPPPTWTRDIEPLEEPWFAVPFPALRAHLLRASPVVFRRRNLFVDASIGDRV